MHKKLEEIRDIRIKSNLLWMSIMDIALRKDPEATKAILAEIRLNDLMITECEQEIVDGQD